MNNSAQYFFATTATEGNSTTTRVGQADIGFGDVEGLANVEGQLELIWDSESGLSFTPI